MSACAIATCSNHYRKTKDKGVKYHSFPMCPNLSKIWISRYKRQDLVNMKCARISSDHFTPSDYIDDMKNRLFGLTQKKILRPNAIPNVNLPFQDNLEAISCRSERKRKTNTSQEAKNRLECLSPKTKCDAPTEPSTVLTAENYCSLCFERQKENKLLLERIRFLEKELEKSKKKKMNRKK